MPLSPTKTTAAIYVRQSVATDGSASIETQVAACRALPAVKAADAVEIYTDRNASGGSIKKRPEYQALLARIEATTKTGPALIVAVYDQSRLNRNSAANIDFYALLEARPWVEVVMVEGAFDRSATGGLTWEIMGSVSSFYRKQTSDKKKAGGAYRNSVGQATGPAPYGYLGVPAAPGGLRTFVPNPDTAPTVRRLFELYDQGAGSLLKLTEIMRAEGLPGPGRTGGWLPNSLMFLLRNVAYIAKTYSINRRDHSGDVITAQWPAIVDEPLFRRVQERLAANALRGGSPSLGREYVFAGLLYCDNCKRRMWAGLKHNQVFYRCHRAGDKPCASTGRKRDRVAKERDLLEWPDRLFEGISSLKLEALRRKAKPVDMSSADGVRLTEGRLARNRDLYQLGDRDRAEYIGERDRLEAQRLAYVAQAAQGNDPVAGLDHMSDRWRVAGPAERRALLGELFTQLHVGMTPEGLRIVGMTARPDRLRLVKNLVAQAFYEDDPEPNPEEMDVRGVKRRGETSGNRSPAKPIHGIHGAVTMAQLE